MTDITVTPVDTIRGKRSTSLIVICPICNHRHTFKKPDELDFIDAFCEGRWYLVEVTP